MQESTTLEKLSQKVSQMLRNYDELRMENVQLKESIERMELDKRANEASVTQLQDELIEKDREIEEIVNKIESILG
jgi:regulator of replication initiation timing